VNTSYVLSLNVQRRDLSASQRSAIATDALPLFEAEAKARQSSTLNRGTASPVKENVPERKKGQARDKAAAALNVNPRYVSDAKAIKGKSPETFEKVRSGEMSIPEAKKQIWADS
jgi:hypothetical protein